MWKIKNDLEMNFMILRKSFYESNIVVNFGKCHYIAISDDDPFHKIIFNNNEIASSIEKSFQVFFKAVN